MDVLIDIMRSGWALGNVAMACGKNVDATIAGKMRSRIVQRAMMYMIGPRDCVM